MAMEAKATLMQEMERALLTEITAADLARVLSVLADKLEGYELRAAAAAQAQQDDLLEAYMSALRIQGRSVKTIQQYRYQITRMMKALGVPTRAVTVYHLRRYLADEKARGLADQTLEGVRQVLSAYFGWLHRDGLIETNPAANLGAIKCAKKIRKVFTEVDIERLNFGCGTPRNRAIIAFLSSTGCRISEMTQLDRDSVDLNTLECRVLGKGNKERTVYMSQVAGMRLREYLDSRTDDDPALFLGKRHERLTPSGVRCMLNEAARAAGVEHVHPHRFRRTLATRLIRHGMPIQEVAAILGHDKLDTTMKYVVLDNSDVKNAYRKYA